MYVLKENLESELEIKKSKFLTKIYKLSSFQEIEEILTRLKEKHPNATHICYAYRYEGNVRYSDDKEPSKTAGYPILQVLEKQQLDHILAVVIRYFGGIKLGANGLVRAYSTATTTALEKKQLCTLKEGYLVQIICPYEKSKQLDYLLREKKNVQKIYQEQILYTFSIKTEEWETFQEFHPTIQKRILIEEGINS